MNLARISSTKPAIGKKTQDAIINARSFVERIICGQSLICDSDVQETMGMSSWQSLTINRCLQEAINKYKTEIVGNKSSALIGSSEEEE